jgi:hypothetical protein
MTSIAKKLSGFFPFIGGKPQVTRQEQLDARPIRNTLVTWEKSDAEITLFIPVQRQKRIEFLAKLLKVPESDRQIQLDEVGSTVWELCDGEHDLNTMINVLTKEYKLSRREAEVSIREFLKMLAQRNLIGLLVGGGKSAKRKS